MKDKERFDCCSLILHIDNDDVRTGLKEGLRGIIIFNRTVLIDDCLARCQLSCLDMSRERVAGISQGSKDPDSDLRQCHMSTLSVKEDSVKMS